MLSHFAKQFAYNAWANRETLASLQRHTPPSPHAPRYFAHVLASEKLWQSRLQRVSTQGFVVWPDWSIEQCIEELAPVTVTWDLILKDLTPEKLAHPVAYINTKGAEWRNTVSDILSHVIVHSGYHRGQAAAAIRASGGEPAYTDYIEAVRRGFIEESLAREERS